MAADTSILLEAREIVRVWSPSLRIGHLRKAADDLQNAYEALKLSCTRETATQFVAAFNRTALAIDRVHEHEPSPPSGARARLPETGESRTPGALSVS